MSFNKKKKITIINYAYSGGGSERVLCNFANLFSQMGYEVDLIILSNDQKRVSIDKKVNIITFGKSRSFYCLPKLLKYFLKNRHNPVLSSQRHINLIVLIAKLITFNKCDFFLRESTCYNLLIDTEPTLKKFVIRYLTPILYKNAKKIICPAEDVRIDFLSSYPYFKNKIEKIYNPIDFNALNNEASKGINTNQIIPKKYAVAVSRLSPEKNIKFLIESFSKIETKDLKLLILGEGRERNNITKQINELGIQNKVILMGHVKNPHAIVSNAVLSLSTSVVEGLPNAVLESIALETPILALRAISGVEELLNNNKCGYTIDTNDSSVFAAKIDQIVSSNIKINLLNEFKLQYSFKNIGQQFERLF